MKRSIYSILQNLFILSLTTFGILLLTAYSLKSQTIAVKFLGLNSSTASFPMAEGSKDPSVVSSGSVNYSGLTPVNDNRWVWNNPNTSSTLDISTAPYLTYKIVMNGKVAISLDRFVMNSLAVFNSNIKLQLRWSIDNFASSLGEFTNNSTGYTLTSINLASQGTVNVSSIEFRIYFYNGSSWVFNPVSGSAYPSADGTPSSYGGNSYSVALWYNSFTVLPVTLKSFSVKKLESNVILNWTTENESGVTNFSIERSLDGHQWNTIGAVPAHNSSGVNQYNFSDAQPVMGTTNYYRISQKSLDGDLKYSLVRAIEVNATGTSLKLVSNPVFSGAIKFRIDNPARVQLFSLSGALLKSKDCSSGINSIEANGIAKGTYLITTGDLSQLVIIQ